MNKNEIQLAESYFEINIQPYLSTLPIDDKQFEIVENISLLNYVVV